MSILFSNAERVLFDLIKCQAGKVYGHLCKPGSGKVFLYNPGSVIMIPIAFS